jgi:hypothetical protein
MKESLMAKKDYNKDLNLWVSPFGFKYFFKGGVSNITALLLRGLLGYQGFCGVGRCPM